MTDLGAQTWRILHIDDDEDDHFIVRSMLSEAQGRKMKLEWAATPDEGRQKLAANHFQAVLVDYDLGRETGIELIREFVARGYEAPLILLTGRGNYEVDVEAMHAGATLYLTKNEINPLLLERSIRYAVERKQTEARLRLSEEKFSIIFDHSPTPTFLISLPDGRFVDANQAFTQMMGFTKEEVLGKTALELGIIRDPEDPLRLATVQDLEQKGYVRGIEATSYTRSGEARTTTANLEVIEIEGKRFLLGTEIDITEQHVLQEENRRQKDLLERMLQAVPVGIAFLKGPQHVYSLVNAEYCRYARGKGDLIGHTVAEKWPEIAAEVIPQMDHVFQTGEPFSIQDAPLQIIRDTGPEDCYFSYTFTPIQAADGRIEGVMILAVDTTAAVHDRQAVEAQSARLEAVLHALPVGVWIADRHGRLVGKNEQADHIWAGDAPLLDNVEQYPQYMAWFADSDQELLPDDYPLAQALRTGQPVSPVELRIRRFDGAQGTVLVSAAPILDSEGRLTGAVAINVDITRQKEAEEALRQREGRMRRLFEANLIGIVSRDADGTILDANDVYLKISGFTRLEIESGACNIRDITPPEYFQLDEQCTQEVLANGFCRPYEKEYMQLDGTRVPVLIGYSLLEGERPEFIGFVLDLSELKAAQAELAAYAKRLKRSNAELENFAFVASHDLQEPLRKIRLFGGSLRRQLAGGLSTEAEQSLERMESAAGRMEAMIQGLLDLSRVNTRGGSFAAVDLTRVAAEVVSDLEASIEEAGGEVRVDPLPIIQGDALQMHQLLLNLVSNALKYRRAEIAPLVRISGELVRSAKGQQARITVEDNGVGFDEKYLNRIFLPFTRLHGRDQYDGSGIGLAICRRIVERHGGEITASSTPGEGSRFTVLLPAG